MYIDAESRNIDINGASRTSFHCTVILTRITTQSRISFVFFSTIHCTDEINDTNYVLTKGQRPNAAIKLYPEQMRFLYTVEDLESTLVANVANQTFSSPCIVKLCLFAIESFYFKETFL